MGFLIFDKKGAKYMSFLFLMGLFLSEKFIAEVFSFGLEKCWFSGKWFPPQVDTYSESPGACDKEYPRIIYECLKK
jgi:hypothetical protein